MNRATDQWKHLFCAVWTSVHLFGCALYFPNLIGHFRDDVTRAVHYGCSSKESFKMASGSSEAGGFTCCVPGCYNNSKKHKGKFSFYNFPGDQTLRRQWLHNISRKDFRPTTGHRVCSAQFEGAFKTYQTTVPTVFPLQTSHPKVITTPRLLVRHKEEEIQEETEEIEPTCSEKNHIDSTNHCNNVPSLNLKTRLLNSDNKLQHLNRGILK